MKYLLIIYLSIFFISPTWGQYKIDMSQIDSPKIKYMKLGHTGPPGKEIRVNNLYMEKGGIPQLPVMAEFHYNRLDHRYWRDALLKIKSSGVNVISTYILWVLHEEFEGRQNWTGRNDLHRFIELCGELDLQVHLRIGPYCNAEIRNGGFPDWMEFNKNFHCRTNDPLYLEYVKYWYKSIFKQVEDLLYKNGGPVIGIQLENEYVTQGLVVSHMKKLKEIAVQIGFDVPIYSMTHWMLSDYPKGELIPYAGYYMETPWIYNEGKDNLTTPQEFFSYNRLSDNIGTDFIKTEGEVESLIDTNESPYFTCENGLGAPSYYQHRGIVPEKTAGETINLRIGCGVNLMGYYVYVGQTNPIGERYVLHRQTARISNDYQAPIKEFGTMGIVMRETKKMNYFMNDFGSELAPLIAYLPSSNKDTTNLQWAIRTDGHKGYLFCSNYLHKHDRKDYSKVQFTVQLKNETITIPRKKTTIKNGVYFFWPFNQVYEGIRLKYATVQPICKQEEDNITSFFFFADDQIDGEFLINGEDISDISVTNGRWSNEKKNIRIEKLTPGKSCIAEMTNKNGRKIRFITLSEPESDEIWKGQNNSKDYLLLTQSTVVADSGKIKLLSENANQEAWVYGEMGFTYKKISVAGETLQTNVTALAPMQKAQWIRPCSGRMIQRSMDATSLSKVEKAIVRLCSSSQTQLRLNNTEIPLTDYGEYHYADISVTFGNMVNQLQICSDKPEEGVIAEVEVLLENGTRWVFSTDHLWYGEKGNILVEEITGKTHPSAYASEEHLGVFQINFPPVINPTIPIRLYINFNGDTGDAYVGNQLIHDRFNDGADWIIGLNRYTEILHENAIILRIYGLKNSNAPIYFEKGINKEDFVKPFINKLKLKKEYSIHLESN